MQTSSLPTLGMLYPLGTEFNVDSAGRVGIGTINPSARLHVAGNLLTEGPLTSNFTGGAPLSVVSSTLVSNLNADRLDGLHASAFSQLGNSIGSNEIEKGAVTTAKLTVAAVTSVKIANSAVTSAKIANGAITTGKILEGAVTSSKIADGTITIADLGRLIGTGSATGLFRVNATGNSASAIYGDVSSGTGVTVAVRGVTASTSGRGVYGLATATFGVNYGLYGATSSNAGNGESGVATASSGSGRPFRFRKGRPPCCLQSIRRSMLSRRSAVIGWASRPISIRIWSALSRLSIACSESPRRSNTVARFEYCVATTS